MQKLPVGHPGLVNPTLDKVDFPHLCNDIRKYKEAGILRDDSFTWWQQFLSKFVETYGKTPDPLPVWPMNIISAYIQDPPTNSEPVISTVISNLHAAQNKPLREVRILQYRYKNLHHQLAEN